jgi:hypothetical protein
VKVVLFSIFDFFYPSCAGCVSWLQTWAPLLICRSSWRGSLRETIFSMLESSPKEGASVLVKNFWINILCELRSDFKEINSTFNFTIHIECIWTCELHQFIFVHWNILNTKFFVNRGTWSRKEHFVGTGKKHLTNFIVVQNNCKNLLDIVLQDVLVLVQISDNG